MSQGVLPLAGDCPTASEHRFEIPLARGPVSGLTLHCDSCAGPTVPSPVYELTEMIAARRLTIAGLAGLPVATRADLESDGTIEALYLGTVADVREAAQRCRAELGRELPAALCPGAPARALPTLDAAAAWLATS